MSKHNDRVFLKHILDASEKIISLTNRGGRKLFDEDFAIADAIVRELLVVGEAARNISPAIRDTHKDIPWKDIIGMRDWLVHGYSEIDWDKVWVTATRDIPKLVDQINIILSFNS